MTLTQYLLTHSYYGKALAVRKVTTNKGKNTSGVDKELWSTPASKMRGVLTLTDKNYKAKPLRRVFIEKKGKKAKRPLGIPCMYDRAMQALYALALEPVAETTADTKSFGFRKGRSCHDACEYIFTALSRKNCAEWVLEGDIKGCFDHISHEWLIDNIPMGKSVLKQFLKAGFIFEKFAHIDYVLFELLWRWAKRRHPHKSRWWVSTNYWHKKGNRSWVFSAEDKELLRLDHIPIVRHTKVRMDANPYFDTQYFLDRKFQHGMRRLSGRFKLIWKNQNGCCYHCGMPMEISDEREIFFKVLKSAGGKDEVMNMAYVHQSCQQIYLECRSKE